MAVKKKVKKSAKKVVKKAKKVIKKVKKVTKKTVKKVVKKTKKTVKKVIKKTKVTTKKIKAKAVAIKPKKIEGKKIGVVTHWFGKINVAILKLSAPLKVGDRIKIVRGETEMDEIVNSMQMNHESITIGKKGMEVGVKIKKEAHEGADVYAL